MVTEFFKIPYDENSLSDEEIVELEAFVEGLFVQLQDKIEKTGLSMTDFGITKFSQEELGAMPVVRRDVDGSYRIVEEEAGRKLPLDRVVEACESVNKENVNTARGDKSLMLWKSDFQNERDWIAACKALGVPEDTVELELRCGVCVAKSHYTHDYSAKVEELETQDFERRNCIRADFER